MGLLDGVLGSVVNSVLGGGGAGDSPLGGIVAGLAGGDATRGTAMLGAVLNMVQQQGGLDGVLKLLRDNGLGEQVDSWVGTGANKAVGGDALARALGSGPLGALASQLGLPQGQAGGALAQLLPELVNQFTPDGKLPADGGALLSRALASLTGGR